MENKFNYIHILIIICITAILVYIFTPKKEYINYEYSEDYKELYNLIQEQKDTILDLQEKINNIEENTKEIISYVDEIHQNIFPDAQQHTLIVKDN